MRTPQQKNGKTHPEQHANTSLPQNENSDPKNPAKKPGLTKTWLVIGTMRYGTKKTEDELDKRAKKILADPTTYGLDTMRKRKLYEYYDWKFVIHTSDLMHALDISERQAQRLLQITREKLNKDKNGYVTVAEFCDLHKINEIETRKKITRRPVK